MWQICQTDNIGATYSSHPISKMNTSVPVEPCVFHALHSHFSVLSAEETIWCFFSYKKSEISIVFLLKQD